MEKKSVGCVIMASGLGKRFGGNKLVANLGKKPVIQWILDTTKEVFEHRVVVTRSEDVQQICKANQVEVILHNEPGRNDTVRLGLSKLADAIDACIFMPADQPFIEQESLEKFLAAVQEDETYIYRASYEKCVGAPVCFPKWAFSELLNLPEGKGGNVVVKKYADKVQTVLVSHSEELWDIDTVEDLQKAQQYLLEKSEE